MNEESIHMGDKYEVEEKESEAGKKEKDLRCDDNCERRRRP